LLIDLLLCLSIPADEWSAPSCACAKRLSRWITVSYIHSLIRRPRKKRSSARNSSNSLSLVFIFSLYLAGYTKILTLVGRTAAGIYPKLANILGRTIIFTSFFSLRLSISLCLSLYLFWFCRRPVVVITRALPTCRQYCWARRKKKEEKKDPPPPLLSSDIYGSAYSM
jgi:hypothetical protein